MLIDIMKIVVTYVNPELISSFFLKWNINFDVKFTYNASHWELSSINFNNMFGQYQGIIITGMYLTDECDIKIPIVHSRVVYLKYFLSTSNKFFCAKKLEKYVNLRFLGVHTSLAINNMEVIYGLKKMRTLFLIFDDDNFFSIDPLVRNLPNLRNVFLPICKIIDGHNIVGLKKLTSVFMHDGTDEQIFFILNKMKKLKLKRIYFSYVGCNALPNLLGHRALRKVVVLCCDELNIINNLHVVKNLRYVEFRECKNLRCVDLRKCKNFVVTNFVDCCGVVWRPELGKLD